MDTANTLNQSARALRENASASGAVQSGYLSFVPVHLHVAKGAHGVLMISPWGIEELCARKTYRRLAERLADKGYPALRFDFPDTSDARGYSATETWWVAANGVLQSFIKQNKLASVTVLAQGVGALLAARLVAEHSAVTGCILLAPVATGRHYLRELVAWSNLMKETYRDETVKGEDGSLRSAGFTLSINIQAELKSLSTAKLLASASADVLLLQRPNHPGDKKLADEIAQTRLDLTRKDFDEFSKYVGDPTLSELPERTLDTIERWLEQKNSPEKNTVGSVIEADALLKSLYLSHTKNAATEEMVRFGAGHACFGVLTLPGTPLSETGIIFLNSGYDHHIGWGGCHVKFARILAEEGHLSLRIDASGVGEAELHDGQNSQILYSESQIPDVAAAVDVLKERGMKKIVLVGRCSGAYLAFLAASSDSRVSTVVLVNTRRFAWDPRQEVDVEIRRPVQPLENYQRKLRDWGTIKSALTSPQKFRTALTKLMRGLYRPFKRSVERQLGSLSVSGRLIGLVHQRMKSITQHGSKVVVLFGDDDMGRSELEYYFGPSGQDLARYSGARVEFISGTDHNLTSETSSQAFLSTLRHAARE
jgi:pimeloyl-ACP methyl ester carboxylesterase